MLFRNALIIGICTFLLAGCEEEAPDAPYVKIGGGGFIFNYNVAYANYGFVAKVLRKIPPGTILEAEFENPAGGEPLFASWTARKGQREYMFQSPPVHGVEKDREYQVELRLLDPADRTVIATYTKGFSSMIGQEVLPKQPTTIGPGNQPNPASSEASTE